MSTQFVKKRDQIDEKYKWKISEIYNDISNWENDFSYVKNDIIKFEKFKGQLSSCEKILDYLKLYEKVSRRYNKLFMYANFILDSDTNISSSQSMMSKIEMLKVELESATSFFVPEILELGEEAVVNLIKDHHDLDIYSKYLKKIFDLKEHILSNDVEEALAQISDYTTSSLSVYSSLCYSDLKFPVISDENGNAVELNDSNFNSFIRCGSRKVRENAFNSLLSRFGDFKNTFSANLLNNVKSVSNVARIKKYNSSIEYCVDDDHIPVSVLNTTIGTINKNLNLLHRYVSLKKKLLGYGDIHMYDLYAPMFDIPNKEYLFEEGVSIVKEGLSILGEDYISVLDSGLKNGWCDVYPNVGKKTGAYSWGSYDTMPYFLLNYGNHLNDVFILAHELGHSLHTYYSNNNQPYIYSEYTLFNAEVASTTNEILLINHLIKNAPDKKMKLYLIAHELEQIRLTVFRQTMFAEFEKAIHEEIDKGNGLSCDDLCNIYYNLNVKYHGEDIIVDDEIKMEWARVAHFYTNFYVYKYVTGYAAATTFANSILNSEEGALKKYKKFLKSGGSDYSIEIQKECGVDITTSTPVQNVVERFSYLLDLLEQETK